MKTLLFIHLGIGVPLLCLILLPTWAGLKTPPPQLDRVPEFRLTDQTGKAFTASDLDGKVTVVDFVFTQCRGICPALHLQMQEVRHQFAGRGDLQLLSISVDPDNDTPERLAAFAAAHDMDDPRWRFLTGDRKDVRALLQDGFKIGMAENPEVHSDRFIVIDGRRTIRGYFSLSDPDRMRQLHPEITKLFKQVDMAQAPDRTSPTQETP